MEILQGMTDMLHNQQGKSKAEKLRPPKIYGKPWCKRKPAK